MNADALCVQVSDVVAYSDGAGAAYKSDDGSALQTAALATAEAMVAHYVGFPQEAEGFRVARYKVAPNASGVVGARPIVQPLTVGAVSDFRGHRLTLEGGYPFTPTRTVPFVEIAAGYRREGDTLETLAALDGLAMLGNLPQTLPAPLFSAVCEVAIYLGDRVASASILTRQSAVDVGQNGVRLTVPGLADTSELTAIMLAHAGAYRVLQV